MLWLNCFDWFWITVEAVVWQSFLVQISLKRCKSNLFIWTFWGAMWLYTAIRIEDRQGQGKGPSRGLMSNCSRISFCLVEHVHNYCYEIGFSAKVSHDFCFTSTSPFPLPLADSKDIKPRTSRPSLLSPQYFSSCVLRY